MTENLNTHVHTVPELTDTLRLRELHPFIKSPACAKDIFDHVRPHRYAQRQLEGGMPPIAFRDAAYFRLVFPLRVSGEVGAVVFAKGDPERAGQLRTAVIGKLGELATKPIVADMYDMVGRRISERMYAQGFDGAIVGVAAGTGEDGTPENTKMIMV